jgi:Zn-finger nucleic acid-binding protein
MQCPVTAAPMRSVRPEAAPVYQPEPRRLDPREAARRRDNDDDDDDDRDRPRKKRRDSFLSELFDF